MKETPIKQLFDQEEIIQNPAWYRACTLKERLASLRALTEKQSLWSIYDEQLAERRLERWRQLSPFKQDECFTERLAMDSLTENELRILLGEAAQAIQARTQAVPVWLQEFAETFTDASQLDAIDGFTKRVQAVFNSQRGTLSASKQSSFLIMMAPLILSGVNRLREGIKSIKEKYTCIPFDADTVYQGFFASLPEPLLQQISRTMTLELNVARLEERLQGVTPEERFWDFVLQISQKEDMLAFFEEYAPLTRILLTTIRNWVDYSLEFLQHLCTDWQDILQMIFVENDPGLLTEIDAGVGDVHRGGRSTLKLTFASGMHLIYKPKSMTIDVHFQELLAWLNEHGDHPAFRLTRVIDREIYGWSEYIRTEGCTTKDEVERFYERQGGYLALLYALEATDVHFENLIASGEHPMMIDLESLFHPHTEMNGLQQVQKIALETINYSVLRVGLLPQRIWGNGERDGVDVSGLNGKGGQTAPQAASVVDAEGTDNMHFTRRFVQLLEKQNRPRLNGENIDIVEYTEHLLTGFAKIYRLLIARREEMLAGPLLRFEHDTIRVIIRPTKMYSQILHESYHPDLLRDALDRDRFFDRLWLGMQQQRFVKKLIASEQADLHAGDIPLFTSRVATRDIYTSWGECIPNFLEESGLDGVRKRLALFNEQDLKRQTWFIQASLATMLLGNGHMVYRRSNLQVTQSQSLQPQMTRERLIQAASSIGDRLCEQALISEHGANWIGLTYVNDREWKLSPAAADLYAGASGIALFLAYLGAVTGTTKYTICARAALATVRELVKEMKIYGAGVGGYEGWGSIFYLYAHLGTIWNEPVLFVEAEKLLAYFASALETDQLLDMIGGSAGGLSCLLSLYSVAPSAVILSAAVQCGDWLIAHAAQCMSTCSERPTASEPQHALTGFSHGAAGMALSLLRLADISGEERFNTAARAAIAYERSTFSVEKQNWPDFRDVVQPDKVITDSVAGEESYMVAWCHGAPGIGLGRLNSLRYLDDQFIREEIDIALHTTMSEGFGLNHSLCHGDLGNLETLLTAALVFDAPCYQEQLDRFTAMILDSVEVHGWRTGIPLGTESPGLMSGIAGIGYELLRLAEPGRVPSILALEEPGKIMN